MAEASPQPGRYFCHCCSVEIVPRLPDYICPRCESGFIEELPEETRSAENGSAPSTAPSDQSRQPFENVDQHLFALPQGYGQFAFGIFDDSFEIPTFPSGAPADDGRDPESRREREQQSRHRYGARQPRARLAARRAAGRHEGVPTLEGKTQQATPESPPVPREHRTPPSTRPRWHGGATPGAWGCPTRLCSRGLWRAVPQPGRGSEDPPLWAAEEAGPQGRPHGPGRGVQGTRRPRRPRPPCPMCL
uniref:RING-type E3 ubiquitin transferase n=1 Tax=Rousettus aegyptiacus TaxID=9407 RepID=A0A7J8BU99_ROUAE|nr:ring finger protein 126 [Rousettus aegyptiacus]